MEQNQPKNQKLLTPLMLVTSALSLSMPVMAYDHEKQLSVSIDGIEIGKNIIQHSSGTQTKNPYTGMPFDTDTD